MLYTIDLKTSTKIIRPDLSAKAIKLCGESGERLWGWTETTKARPCAPDLLASAWWRWELRPDRMIQQGNFRRLLLASSRYLIYHDTFGH